MVSRAEQWYTILDNADNYILLFCPINCPIDIPVLLLNQPDVVFFKQMGMPYF